MTVVKPVNVDFPVLLVPRASPVRRVSVVRLVRPVLMVLMVKRYFLLHPKK